MIILTEIPMTHDPIKYSGSVTDHESVDDVIKWIVANSKSHRGTIEVEIHNGISSPNIMIPFKLRELQGSIPRELADLHVYGFASNKFETIEEYTVWAVDPNNAHSEDEDWEE